MSQLVLRDEWYTPDETYRDLAERYGPFDLDVAASALNAKSPRYFTTEDDALVRDWKCKRAWCNPPYRNLLRWVTKALCEVRMGNAERVVMLLPSHTSTTWFHVALKMGRVEFLKGKLKFGGAKGVPFTGSVVVIFDALAGSMPLSETKPSEPQAKEESSTIQILPPTYPYDTRASDWIIPIEPESVPIQESDGEKK